MTYLDLLYLSSLPVISPYLLYKTVVKGKYRKSARNMFGIGLEKYFSGANFKDTLWIHSVSVGEVVAAKPIFDCLRETFPEKQIIVSTITEAGQKMAQSRLAGADAFIYFPIDVSAVVKKFLTLFKPKVFISMETELWPNFLGLAHKFGTKTFLANGKISPSSYKNYKRFNFIFASVLKNMSAFCMQTEQDAQRIIELGVDSKKVFVTGNCKFDFPPITLGEDEKQQILRRIKIGNNKKIIVAGSTHPGEEKIIIEAFLKCKKEFPNLALILAPRHPERFGDVFNEIIKYNIATSRNSNPNVENPDVLILDTIGDLAKYYGVGEMAIVGGSFVPIGGHNLLEAAVHKIPVVYGPYMHKQPEITKIINEQNGGIRTNANNLEKALLDLLKDDAQRKKIGAAAHSAANKNQGSAKKTLDIIKGIVEE